jgi:competence protein ComEC
MTITAGMAHYRQSVSTDSPMHLTRQLGIGGNIRVRGWICSDVIESSRRFTVEVTELQRGETWVPVAGRVMVFPDDEAALPELRYGDEVECGLLAQWPSSARNPGAFDWRRWLERQGIYFTGKLRETDVLTLTGHDRGRWWQRTAYRVRDRFLDALRHGLETEPGMVGVLGGMVIGQRADIPEDTHGDFQRTGVFHVFAVSGLHVALVAMVVVGVLQLAQVPRRWCGLVALPVLVMYVLATGARPGATRALVMAAVWLTSWALVRPTDGLNALGAAAILILAFDPSQLFDGGFVLSFAVVAALIVVTPIVAEPLLRRFDPDPFLIKEAVPGWRQALDMPVRRTVQLVSGSMAAWVGMLPLMALYFNLFTPISVIANVVVIPLLGSIISLGMLATIAFPIWPWLTETLNNANFFLLSIMTRSVEWLGKIPFGYEYVATPPVWAIWAYYMTGSLLLVKRWRRWWMVPLLPAAFLIVLWAGDRSQEVRVTVLDLTDGAAIFVDAPGEDRDLLLDGGGDWSGKRVVVPFLRSQGVDQLAAIALTRGDKAHAAGLGAVMDEVGVREALYTAQPTRSIYYEAWLDDVKRHQVPLRMVREGETIELERGAKLRVLHPPRYGRRERSEDNSLVVLLEHGSSRILLLSDIGETVEKDLLERAATNLSAQVVVKGRHGKETSFTPAFLDAVKPETVVMAVNTRSTRRYLSPEERIRLESRGIALLRTDETGAVTIRVMPDGYQIRTFRSK